jgi:hypothetical protein
MTRPIKRNLRPQVSRRLISSPSGYGYVVKGYVRTLTKAAASSRRAYRKLKKSDWGVLTRHPSSNPPPLTFCFYYVSDTLTVMTLKCIITPIEIIQTYYVEYKGRKTN